MTHSPNFSDFLVFVDCFQFLSVWSGVVWLAYLPAFEYIQINVQWRRQDFVTEGGSEVWVYRGSRVRSPPVPVVLSVYQRGSLPDGLAMYLSCDTKKFHDNESTHILRNFRTSTHRGEASPLPPGGATVNVQLWEQ